MHKLQSAIAVLVLLSRSAYGSELMESAFGAYVESLRGDRPGVLPPTFLSENPPPKDLFPLLARYKDDPSARVRSMIASHLWRYPTDEALDLQVNFLNDGDAEVRRVTAAGLLRELPAERLQGKREAIAQAVLRHLGEELQAEPFLLLLASAPQPDRVVQALRAWRKGAVTRRKLNLWRHWPLWVHETFAADVVLAELGDREALSRALGDCEGIANAKNAAFVAKVSSWLANPRWLGVVEARVNDRTIIEDRGSHVPDNFLRSCDFAVEALVRKKRIKVSFDPEPLRAYTEDELKAASAALSSK